MSAKNILICPLNWGLGHATRDVPIINLLLKHQFKVLIAGCGDSLTYLKKEFPALEFIHMEGYVVRYSPYESQLLQMAALIPRIVFWSIKELQALDAIIKAKNIDVVISDHRFGLWNRKTYNIFITHQLKLKFPKALQIFETIYQCISNLIIKKYDECWIPDFAGENNLSGKLSHVKNKLKNSCFIGPLSRFEYEEAENKEVKFDVLFILSGPEPQRSIFEKIIYEQTKSMELNYAIVRGTSLEVKNKFRFPVFNILHSEELRVLINQSKLIVCRSGYSSVMDLFCLKKKAVLVPTPGQTEQEYLAEFLLAKGYFYTINQKSFSLRYAIKKVVEFPEMSEVESRGLEKRIVSLKEKDCN